MNWNYNALRKQTDSEFEFVLKILKELIPNKGKVRVLDVGCSDGYNTSKMFNQFENVEVIGIDSSKDAIKKASTENPGIYFECVDIENADELNDFYFNHEKFDVVYCSHLIQHLADPKTFFKQVRYFLLKPGGYFIIKTVDDSTKFANYQNDVLQYTMHYYQTYVAPFQKLRVNTNRFIGSSVVNLLEGMYYNITRYDYKQTTKNLSKEDRLKLYEKCFHFRGLTDCIRMKLPTDDEYLKAISMIKDLFTRNDYVFSTSTLLFIAQNAA
mgnify:FL=1